MTVEKVPEKYRCSDGRKFDNEKDAERHEQLIKAKEDYEIALRQYNVALVQSCKTADGKPFKLGIFKTYYYVRRAAFGMPHFFEVPYLGWNFNVSTEDDKVTIHHQEGDRRMSFRVSEVYADKSAAELALLEAQKEALKEYAEGVAKLEAKLKP